MPFMVNPASPPEVMLFLSAPLRETILILFAFAFFAALREMRFLVVRLSEERTQVVGHNVFRHVVGFSST